MLRLRNLLKHFFYFQLLIVIGSCNLINPEEQAPAYIEINNFTFDPTPTLAELGPSTSTKIKDVWVYIDNEFLGTYELPARFPVLKSGIQKINLSPGIFLNGIASTRSPYPFYTTPIFESELKENQTLTLNPITSYFNTVKSAYSESFEGSGFSFTSTPSSDTVMYQLPAGDPNVFEGAGSGVVYLDTANTFFEIATTSEYPLPGSGAAVFLEFDYKVNQNVSVGLFVNTGSTQEQIPIYTLNPTTSWNKIYIQLGYTVSAYGGLSSNFKVFFGAIKDPSVEKPAFYLDNIKVVHF